MKLLDDYRREEIAHIKGTRLEELAQELFTQGRFKMRASKLTKTGFSKGNSYDMLLEGPIREDRVHSFKEGDLELQEVVATGWHLHVPNSSSHPAVDFVLENRLGNGTSEYVLLQVTISSPKEYSGSTYAADRLLLTKKVKDSERKKKNENESEEEREEKVKQKYEKVKNRFRTLLKNREKVVFMYVTKLDFDTQHLDIKREYEEYDTDLVQYIGNFYIPADKNVLEGMLEEDDNEDEI